LSVRRTSSTRENNVDYSELAKNPRKTSGVEPKIDGNPALPAGCYFYSNRIADGLARVLSILAGRDRELAMPGWLPAAALVALLAPSSCAWAASWHKLVAPGPVVESHAEYEQDCDKCHQTFDKKNQRPLCLACHDKVAADIKAGTGFHGRDSQAAAVECRHCHTDHKGRREDIVRLDPQTFDHARTDMPLTGRHRHGACTACHLPGKAFREAPVACVDCHEKDDAHRNTLGRKCADCHDATGWRKTDFDHAATDFVLDGRHRDVACGQCHPDKRYKPTPATCIGCHRLNDVHTGKYGERCDACHGTGGWKKATFDHDRKTKFPLAGRHRAARCDACHKGGDLDARLGKACIDCHKAQDFHRGRFGERCDQCHDERAWKNTRFDHEREAKLALRGKHARLECVACHYDGARKPAKARVCNDCHAARDVHKGTLGKACSNCHGENDWIQVRFDHDLAPFALIGLHAVVPCEECHSSGRFKGVAGECIDCHAAKDVHKGGLGKGCGTCHNPNGWRLWRFDHAEHTTFALDGAHAELRCHACHKEVSGGPGKLPNECSVCHAGEDIHDGRFGPLCQRCHTTKSFKDLKLSGFNR